MVGCVPLSKLNSWHKGKQEELRRITRMRFVLTNCERVLAKMLTSALRSTLTSPLTLGLINGVYQMPRTPAFRVASGEFSQLSCGPLLVGPPRNSESTPSSVMTLNKSAGDRKEIYFLCTCTMLVILMSILNALHTWLHCYFISVSNLGIARFCYVPAMQCKVVLFVFELVCWRG